MQSKLALMLLVTKYEGERCVYLSTTFHESDVRNIVKEIIKEAKIGMMLTLFVFLRNLAESFWKKRGYSIYESCELRQRQ